MGKLDFSIAINLLTENFKRGANEVKSAFSSMQAKFMTFAAAMQIGDLSIGGFFNSLIDIARKTNEATIALQNVSRGAQQYANDQRFLINLAKQYGIEINGLTLQYARFTSAANVQGMAVSNQHKVFSSVSRAVAAFSLSSENAQRVFMALERMVSTNTINSKELRMEMGMQLPVAMEAMAMATGKSVEQMEKMMKSGKLLAKDVLPKFADALNKLIPNVNTNHLETSLNRLHNAETAFTQKTGVQDTYKALIDWLTSAITAAGNNIKNIITEIVAVIAATVLAKARTLILNLKAQAGSLEAQSAKSNAALIASTRARIDAEIALGNAKKDAITLSDGTMVENEKAINAAEITLQNAKNEEEKALEDMRVANAKIADDKRLTNAKTTAAKYVQVIRQRMAAEQELEAANTELSGVDTGAAQIAAEERVTAAKKSLKRLEVQEAVAAENAELAATEAAAVKKTSVWTSTFNTMKAGAASFAASFKNIWSTYGPMVILTLITSIIFRFIELRKESQRIKGIWNEYQKGIYQITHTQEIEQLKTLQQQYNNATGNLKLQKQIREQISSVLGYQITAEDNVNKIIKDRIGLLEETAKAQYYTQQKIQSDDRKQQISDMFGGAANYNKFTKTFRGYTTGKNALSVREARTLMRKHGLDVSDSISDDDLVNYINEFNQQARVSYNAHKELLGNHAVSQYPTMNNTPDAGKHHETEFEKIQDNYVASYRDLHARLKGGDIGKSYYNNELDKLNKETYYNIIATGDKSAINSRFTSGLKYDKDHPKGTDELGKAYSKITKAADDNRDKLDKLTMEMRSETEGTKEYTTSQKELSKLSGKQKILDETKQKIEKQYQDALDEAKNEEITDNLKTYNNAKNKYEQGTKDLGAQREQGLTQEAYQSAIDNLTQETLGEMTKIPVSELSDVQKGEIASLQATLSHKVDEIIQKAPDRDMATGKGNDKKDETFDYKKTKSDIAQEKFDTNKQAIEYYQEQLKSAGSFSTTKSNELRAKLTEAQQAAPDLEKAMKIEKIKSDIEEMNKSLIGVSNGFSPDFEGTYAKIAIVKDAFVDLQGTISSLHETFSKSGDYWNKFMTLLESSFSIFNTIIEAVQNFKEIEKTIKSLTGATQTLDAVNKVSASTDTAVTGVKVANSAATATADTTATGTQVANAAIKVKANTATAASGAAASVAGIPIVGIGLAVAGVAAILALMNKLPKFANGGIVGGGSTSGDNVLARVNSGEMILNAGQQSKLLNMINNGTVGGNNLLHTTVVHNINGNELKLIINNEIRRTGGTLIGLKK